MSEKRFSKKHEWVSIEGETATVGITKHATEMLGDIVFVEVPEQGKSVEKEGQAAVVESTKAASDVYSPISGEILEGNKSIVDDPGNVNSDPGTSNKLEFSSRKVKNNAITGRYVFEYITMFSDGTGYSLARGLDVFSFDGTNYYPRESSNNLNDTTENIKDDDSVKLDLSNNHSANFKNLEPGNYDVCIKVVGQESFEQCFELTVKEPQPLAASTKVDNSDGLVQFNLRGSSTYYLNHNGESKIIEENNPIINLKPGLNTVEISTENNCQGIIIKEFFNSEKVEYYPNPTNGIVNFYIHGNDNHIEINTLDSRGNSIMNNSFNVPLSRKIQIDFSENIKGVYFVKINSENVKKTIKIIKE